MSDRPINQSPDQALKRRSGRALTLSALGNWFSLITGLVSLVILSRLLGPEPFGEYVLLLAVIALPQVIITAGLNESLIQHPDLSPGHLDTTFAVAMLGVLVILTLFGLSSAALLNLIGTPHLVLPFMVLAAILPLEALMTVPTGLLQRRMDYGSLIKIDIIGSSTALIVGVGLAILTQSVWALVASELARRSIRLVFVYYYTRWSPGLDVKWAHFRDLIAFNGLVTLTELLQTYVKQMPRLALGTVLGTLSLGYFNLATRLREQGNSAFVKPFGAISLPVASELSRTETDPREMIQVGLKLSSFLAYPAFLGAAAVAPLAVPLLFGQQWLEAIVPVQIALLMALRSPSNTMNSGIMKGFGKPQLALYIRITNTLLISIIVFACLPFGLVPTMLGILVQQYISWGISLSFVKSLTRLSIWAQIIAGWKSLLSSLVMVAGVLTTQRLLADIVSDVVLLILCVLVGVITFIVCITLLAPRFPGTVRRLFSKKAIAPKTERISALIEQL